MHASDYWKDNWCWVGGKPIDFNYQTSARAAYKRRQINGMNRITSHNETAGPTWPYIHLWWHKHEGLTKIMYSVSLGLSSPEKLMVFSEKLMVFCCSNAQKIFIDILFCQAASCSPVPFQKQTLHDKWPQSPLETRLQWVVLSTTRYSTVTKVTIVCCDFSLTLEIAHINYFCKGDLSTNNIILMIDAPSQKML